MRTSSRVAVAPDWEVPRIKRLFSVLCLTVAVNLLAAAVAAEEAGAIPSLEGVWLATFKIETRQGISEASGKLVITEQHDHLFRGSFAWSPEHASAPTRIGVSVNREPSCVWACSTGTTRRSAWPTRETEGTGPGDWSAPTRCGSSTLNRSVMQRSFAQRSSAKRLQHRTTDRASGSARCA